MKLSCILSVLFFLLSSSAIADEITLSCSVDSNGKAIVLDSTKPDKVFKVAKLKARFAEKKNKLKSQKDAVRANSKLTRAQKQARLDAIKIKQDANKVNLALVKSCRNGSPVTRTQLVVDNIKCYTGLFHDCSFHGFLLPQSDSSACAQSRTIVVTRDGGIPVSEGTTGALTVVGNWDASIDLFPGAGTYTFELLERDTGSTLCAGAKNVYDISAQGDPTTISTDY